MPELNAILVESRRQVAEERKFTAALQGVDLDAGATEDAFRRVQERAKEMVEEKTGKKLADPGLGQFINNGIDFEEVVEVTNG